MKYTQEFEQLWMNYPKRAGGNPKIKAYKQYLARLRDKYEYKSMLNGLIRYKRFCESTGKVKTEFVMQASKFFGADEWFLELWEIPEPKERTETIEQKGVRLGIVARPGESMDAYKQRIQQTRG